MASPSARAKRFAMDRYAQPAKEIAEGIEILVPQRGEVGGVIQGFIAELQASMGYVGARSIPDLWQRARFVLLTPPGSKK